jgi:hypothetical protein
MNSIYTLIHVFRLILVIVRLYLNFTHVMLAFSLPLIHQHSSSRLQHSAHSHINIRFLSLSQHHHFRLNYFRIHLVDNELEKIY